MGVWGAISIPLAAVLFVAEFYRSRSFESRLSGARLVVIEVTLLLVLVVGGFIFGGISVFAWFLVAAAVGQLIFQPRSTSDK